MAGGGLSGAEIPGLDKEGEDGVGDTALDDLDGREMDAHVTHEESEVGYGEREKEKEEKKEKDLRCGLFLQRKDSQARW